MEEMGIVIDRAQGHEVRDEGLMLQYQQCKQAAFETLYLRDNDTLYRYFFKILQQSTII